jgi:hypothetical protein
MMDSFKQEDCAVNFSHVLFTLLDFLTLENGTDRFPQKVIKELLLHATYLRRLQISHDNFVM